MWPNRLQAFSSLFPQLIRVAETDKNGGNGRAEGIILEDRSGPASTWSHLHSLCLAHKAHSCASKCWSLSESVISGMIHTSKTLSQSGAKRALNQAVAELIKVQLQVVPRSGFRLSAEAELFRHNTMTFFAPPAKQSRRLALVRTTVSFFNTDWRSPVVAHACEGPMCCRDRAFAVAKGTKLFQMLLKAVPPAVFNKSN